MNYRFRLAAMSLPATLLVIGIVSWAGCKPTPPPPNKDQIDDPTSRNPWEAARDRLKKDTDSIACKAALGNLKDLAGREKELQPPGLSSGAESALISIAPLAPDDLAEVRSATYTSLDAPYLAECFYLHEVATKSLANSGPSPARRAEIAFAWVCRQVYLDPWVLGVPNNQQITAALPPTYVLRRGSGSGLERAYVFLALLQQMNLDACLIGAPDSGMKEATQPYPAGSKQPARGPFWAVGVRVDNDVLLFDPWRGKAFPEPLSKLKANPGLLKDWFEEKESPSPLTAQDVQNAALFLTAPMNALAPRMAFFEEKLKGDIGVDVSVDAAGLLDRFRKAAQAGTQVAFWKPPAVDRFAHVHVLAEFLPLNEGGRDRAPDEAQLFILYNRVMLPTSVRQLPRELRNPTAANRLSLAMVHAYLGAFFAAPTPRERLQRGQFQDAASFLHDKQTGFARGQERLRQVLATPGLIESWCQRADEVYDDLRQARRPNVGGAQLPDSDPEVAAALSRVEEFWKQEGQTAQIIVDRATVPAGMTESTFLLALCKHEEAEQAQLRADAATGATVQREKDRATRAWGEADGLWRSYLEQVAGQDPFPRRVEHARKLAERAGQHYKKK